MTIRLPEDLKQFVHAAVHTGRYAREEDVVRDALVRLKHATAMENWPDAQRTSPAKAEKESLTRQEFDEYLLNSGLISHIPETDADFDDPDDQVIEIKGEPLSETVIRERR